MKKSYQSSRDLDGIISIKKDQQKSIRELLKNFFTIFWRCLMILE